MTASGWSCDGPTFRRRRSPAMQPRRPGPRPMTPGRPAGRLAPRSPLLEPAHARPPRGSRRLNERLRATPPLDVLRFAREFGRARGASSPACSARARRSATSPTGPGLELRRALRRHRRPPRRDARDPRRPPSSPPAPPRHHASGPSAPSPSRPPTRACSTSRRGPGALLRPPQIAPLLALRGRYDALIGALRREEGGARAGIQTFSLDPEMGALRVHPFALLHAREARSRTSPTTPTADGVNPLHAWGFPTIGCFPCTTPVLPGERRARRPLAAPRQRRVLRHQPDGPRPRRRPRLSSPDRYAAFL